MFWVICICWPDPFASASLNLFVNYSGNFQWLIQGKILASVVIVLNLTNDFKNCILLDAIRPKFTTTFCKAPLIYYWYITDIDIALYNSFIIITVIITTLIKKKQLKLLNKHFRKYSLNRGRFREVLFRAIWLGYFWYFEKVNANERWSLTRSGRKGRFDCIPSHGLFTLLITEFTERFQMWKETGNIIDATCLEIFKFVIWKKCITFTSVATVMKVRPEEDP